MTFAFQKILQHVNFNVQHVFPNLKHIDIFIKPIDFHRVSNEHYFQTCFKNDSFIHQNFDVIIHYHRLKEHSRFETLCIIILKNLISYMNYELINAYLYG